MTSDRRTPRSTILGAYLEGWRRTGESAVVVVSVSAFALCLAWLLEVRLALPFADMVAAYTRARVLLEQGVVEPATTRLLAAGILMWLFVSGGILDRIARARPVRTAAFFAACGVSFARFLRLELLWAPAYWLVLARLYPYVFGTLWHRWAPGLATAQEGHVLRAAFYVLIAMVLMLLHLVTAYAKVRTVVEDRRSMIGAAGAAIRFVRRRPLRILGLLGLNLATMAAVVRFWYSAAPDASDSHLYAFVVTHLFVLLFTVARMAWMASDVVFFQGELAHATYTAAPLPVWPESPAAEALENLRNR